MPYADLLRFNPWWEDKKAINKDPDILEFEGEKIKHYPELEVEKGVCVVRGPRQVGKTTLVKLKVRELLGKGVGPENVFFYSFELLKSAEQVHSIVLEYLEGVAGEGKRFVFLDETTSIPDWSRALKLLIDRGDLRKSDLVLVTGSSSLDLKKGAERLPGRGIEGNEFYYLPCSFAKYLELKGVKTRRESPFKQQAFLEAVKENAPKLLTLNKEFYSYLNHGGFLYAINHGKSELTMEKYARWLEGDFIKWGKNPLIVKEILQAVIRKSCSQFSYHSIAKETSMTSHNTIIEYMEMLGEELFLETVNKASLPFKVERRKEKKAFFLDPLLSAIAEKWALETLPEPCKVEQLVLSQLSRLDGVYFYNEGRKEIDALLNLESQTMGVEVKWSDNIGAGDVYGVKKTSTPYVLSKETIKTIDGVPVMPVSLFLATLNARELVKRKVLSL
ncbi:MAG TPA: ATP-binding protein [archaeon]|nr:ATP-binding protein [archaeon]